MNFKKRRRALREHLSTESLGCLLVVEPKNIQYLTGFTGSSGWLVVSESSHTIITDSRYWDQVARQSPEAKLFNFVPKQHTSLPGALIALLIEQKPGLSESCALGVDTYGFSLESYRGLKTCLEKECINFRDVESWTKGLREIKDEEEVRCLQIAADIADRALSKALLQFGPGQRERDLKAQIEFHILTEGGSGTSFSTIVASGLNGSLPHAGASEKVVKEGELITIDFGAIYQGYCSDMTRTVWYGTLPTRERELLEATRIAQDKAVRSVKAGIEAKALDLLARECLGEQDLANYFSHSLGHGVGLDIHEMPGIRKSSDVVLKAGHVITIEPGVYLSGQTGCRVEDTVLVTKDSFRVLNAYPKQVLGSDSPPALA